MRKAGEPLNAGSVAYAMFPGSFFFALHSNNPDDPGFLACRNRQKHLVAENANMGTILFVPEIDFCSLRSILCSYICAFLYGVQICYAYRKNRNGGQSKMSPIPVFSVEEAFPCAVRESGSSAVRARHHFCARCARDTFFAQKNYLNYFKTIQQSTPRAGFHNF